MACAGRVLWSPDPWEGRPRRCLWPFTQELSGPPWSRQTAGVPNARRFRNTQARFFVQSRMQQHPGRRQSRQQHVTRQPSFEPNSFGNSPAFSRTFHAAPLTSLRRPEDQPGAAVLYITGMPAARASAHYSRYEPTNEQHISGSRARWRCSHVELNGGGIGERNKSDRACESFRASPGPVRT